MKPEDIPNEAWEAAYKAVYRGDWTVVEQVARAIMAAEKRGEEREREACELIAQDWTGGAEYIAAAIRNRGKP